MSPKMINKEERKLEIALVALDLFAEKGFEATSISQVAQAAGIGKGTIYEYFTSKEDLISSAFMAWMENMMGPELEDVLMNVKNAEERLRRSVQLIMEAFVSDERTIKITINFFQILLQGTLSQKQTFHNVFSVMWKMFSDAILEGVAQGIFRPEIAPEAQTITMNLFAYLDGIAFHYQVNKNDIDMAKQVDFYLDRLFQYMKF